MMEEECDARRSATLLSDDSLCVEAGVEAAPRRSCFPLWRWKCRAPKKPAEPAEPSEPPGPE